MKFSIKNNNDKIPITPHLTRGEIECHCGCGFGLEDNEFTIHVAQAFEQIRQRIGKPITVSSGCRCDAWNTLQGGTDHSQHLNCNALDLICPSSIDYEKFYKTCVSVIGNSGGVGYYQKQNFVHIDLRGWKARWNA